MRAVWQDQLSKHLDFSTTWRRARSDAPYLLGIRVTSPYVVTGFCQSRVKNGQCSQPATVLAAFVSFITFCKKSLTLHKRDMHFR